VAATVTTTFKCGGDKSPSSHTKLRLCLQPSASPSDVFLMSNSHCPTWLGKSCLVLFCHVRRCESSLRVPQSATVCGNLGTVCAICHRASYTLFTTKQWNLGRSAAHVGSIIPVKRLDLSFNILTMFSSRIFRRRSRIVAKGICGADAVATKPNGRIQSGRVLCRSKDFNQIMSEYVYFYFRMA